MIPNRILTALLLALSTAPAWAQADTYPAKPVRVVVGFAPGGPTDVVARAFADHASRVLGQPVVVENRPGANTIIAAQAVATAAADGYTLLFGATNHSMIPALYSQRVTFDAVASFQPLCVVATSPTVLVVGPDSPSSSLQAFLDRAKREPGRVSAGTAGVGSSGHFATEVFARDNGVALNHVPYKGAAPVVTDLMGNQLDSSFATLASVLPHVQNAKLKALAVAAGTRSTLLPEVPTFQEAGAKGDFKADAWYGVLAPAGTPAPIVQKLEQVAADFARSDAGRQKLIALGLDPVAVCGAPFAEQVRHEVKTYTELARDLKLQAE